MGPQMGFRYCLMSAELRRVIISLDVVPMLLFVHPRVLLDLAAARAHGSSCATSLVHISQCCVCKAAMYRCCGVGGLPSQVLDLSVHLSVLNCKEYPCRPFLHVPFIPPSGCLLNRTGPRTCTTSFLTSLYIEHNPLTT